MTFVGEEKKKVTPDIRKFLLSQKGEFSQHPIVRIWVDSTKVDYKAKLTTIRRYFSGVKKELEEEGLIEHTRTEKLKNGMTRKFYRVI